MTKFLLLLGFLSVLARPTQAQSIADLLLALELDKEKLTSLKNTLQEMYQGYMTLERGYTNIRDIAKGNFDLHKAFLDALFEVSPAVQGDPRIPEILDVEYRIVAGYRSANARWTASGMFTAQEIDYIVSGYSLLLDRCLQSVEELTMVLTGDELRMSDADRIQAVGRIQTDTQGQLATMQQLDNNLSILTMRRLKERGDINTIKSLYGLPN
jgi:hypothetical protein